jgi:ribonuclease J
MYRWIKPKIAIPVHGEARHLHEHLAFARRLGIPQALEVRNGDLVRLAPAPAEIIDTVPTGRLVLENDGLVAAGDDLFRTRRRLMAHGTVQVGLVLDRYGTLLASPQLSAFGAVDLGRESGLRETVQTAIEDAVEELDDEAALDDEQIRTSVRIAVRRAFKLVRERRPIIEVQITRLDRAALEGLLDEAGAAR